MSEIQLIARYVISPGKEDEVNRLLGELATASRGEAGNVSFEAFAGLDDPRRIVLLERYRDAAALAAHRERPHFADLVLGRIVPLLESRVLETYDVPDEA